MNTYLVPMLIAILLPYLAGRQRSRSKWWPWIAAAPAALAIVVRMMVDIGAIYREALGLVGGLPIFPELAWFSMSTAFGAISYQLAYRRYGYHLLADRAAVLQLGLATLWFGSGLETLPISAGFGGYPYWVIGFVLVCIIPDLISRLVEGLPLNKGLVEG